LERKLDYAAALVGIKNFPCVNWGLYTSWYTVKQ